MYHTLTLRVSAFGDIGYVAAKTAMGEFGDFRTMVTPPAVPYIPFDSGSTIFSL